MSIIDSLYVALGFKSDTTGLKQFQSQVNSARESIFTFGNALKALATGYAVKEIAAIGSTFEQNRIQIAGFLSGLGLSSDFNVGLKDADKTIQSITTAAATLPGEAEDYITVFKTALPFVQQAIPGGSIDQITDFTNKLTAVGKTFGIASSVIGHEADALLGPQGRASIRFPLFVQLQSFMRKIPGQAKMTAESFNQMSQPERLKLMADSFKLLQPMLDASADSFDAMWGAAVSGVKQLTRFITKPIFEAMKVGLQKLNAMFFKSNGALTDFGEEVVAVGKQIGHWILQLVEDGRRIINWIVDFGKSSKEAKIILLGVAAALYGVDKALKAGVLGAVILLADELITLSRGGDTVIGLLLNEFPEAMQIAGAALAVFTAAAVGKFIFLQAQAVAAFLKIAIANAAAWAPFLLGAVAIGALIWAGYELYKNWDIVIEGLSNLWTSFIDELKTEINWLSDTLGVSAMSKFFGIGSGHLTTSEEGRDQRTADLTAANKAAFYARTASSQPGATGFMSMTGADAGAGRGAAATSSSVSTTTTNHFKIDGSKNPIETAKEVKKIFDLQNKGLVRNGAGTVGL